MSSEGESEQRGPWCKCGHSFDDHSFLRDTKTYAVEETWCMGIDSKRTSEITADESDKVMKLNVTCQCREFMPLEKEYD